MCTKTLKRSGLFTVHPKQVKSPLRALVSSVTKNNVCMPGCGEDSLKCCEQKVSCSVSGALIVCGNLGVMLTILLLQREERASHMKVLLAVMSGWRLWSFKILVKLPKIIHQNMFSNVCCTASSGDVAGA
jgi:hypothetical protein